VEVVGESMIRAGNSVGIGTVDITRINLRRSVGGCTPNISIAKWPISTIFPVSRGFIMLH
jgi:hypothetical protein